MVGYGIAISARINPVPYSANAFFAKDFFFGGSSSSMCMADCRYGMTTITTLGIMGPRCGPLETPGTWQHHGIGGFKGVLNWASIVPRDASVWADCIHAYSTLFQCTIRGQDFRFLSTWVELFSFNFLSIPTFVLLLFFNHTDTVWFQNKRKIIIIHSTFLFWMEGQIRLSDCTARGIILQI